jgi:integrase
MRKPWYRRQTRMWYVQLTSGEQVPLGRDETEYAQSPKRPPQEIADAWHKVMSDRKQLPLQKDPKIGELVDTFIAGCQTSDETREWYRIFLSDFSAQNPKLKASQIRKKHVDAWLNAERKRTWGPSTRRSAITILKRCLNWAVEDELIPENPIRTMDRPAATRRERVLTTEEHGHILSWYPEGDPFRDFLIAMTESGARPGEIAKVEAKDVSLKAGTWTLHGKTTKRTGKMRTIYMTPTLTELTKRLMAEHPEGPLFCNEDGNPWTRQAINCRFRRKKVRKKDALSKDVVAYTYRATWATDALENEVPDATVAELMGHSGTAMVHKHYSKLNEKREYLRKAAEKATKKS